jgi:hypothetical protein
MSGKYYPNNWQEYKDSPDEFFEPHTFEEVMSWKVAGWELPSSVCCIIRANTSKGKIKEFVYQKQSAAEAKVQALMHEGVEFTVCTDEAIHFVSPNADDYDEPDYD